MLHAETPIRAAARWSGPRLQLLGAVLLLGALVAFLFPAAYSAIQTVGTTDNRTLDAAGYESWRGIGAVEATHPERGDDVLSTIIESQRAAARNKEAADRRSLALLLGIPGAFLVGRNPKQPQQNRRL